MRRHQDELGAARRELREVLVAMTDDQVRAWRTWSTDERGNVQRELERVADAVIIERRRGPAFRSGVDVRGDQDRRGR